MKFKKLTIHNIASIKDAVIDFTAEPLASSDVFLISGKTGAGKSTILDCISLALFNDIPRYTALGSASIPDDDNLNLNNVQQVMRRGTGECYTTLLFSSVVAGKEVEYEATWSLARAYRRPDGNLQPVQRSLKYQGITLLKKGDIEDVIKGQLGLEFKQFCRTTMLAQGEFTRFLKANDKEKSDILGRLAGVDIYEKIGRKIYDVVKLKEQAYSSAQLALDAKKGTLLDDEKKKELEESRAALEVQQKQNAVLSESVTTRLNWLKKDAELKEALEKLRGDLARKEEEANDPEFVRDAATAQRWDESADARSWLAQQASLRKKAADIKNQLSDKAKEYIALQGAVAWQEGALRKLDDEMNELQKSITGKKPLEDIYNKASDISASAAVIAANDKEILRQQKIIDGNKEKLGNKKEDKEKLLSAVKSLKEELAEMQKSLGELREKLEKTGIESLRSKANSLREQQTALTAYKASVAEYLNSLTLRAARLKEVEDAGKSLAELSGKRADAEQKLDKAKEEYDKKDAEYRKQSSTIEEWTVKLRASLHQGDTCPVCRRIIEQQLPSEESICALLQSQKDECDRLKLVRDDCQKALSDITALIKTTEDAKSKAQSALEADEQQFNAQKDKALAIAAELNQNDVSYATAQAIEDKLKELSDAIKSNDEAVSAASALEKEVSAQQDIVTAKQKEIDLKDKKVSILDTEIAALVSAIDSAKSSIDECGQQRRQSLDSFLPLVKGHVWGHDPEKEPSEFALELQTQANEYANMLQKEKDIAADRKRQGEDCARAKEFLAQANTLLEPYIPTGSVISSRKENQYLTLSSTLEADARGLKGNLETTDSELKQVSDNIDKYLADHPGVTLEQLTELAALSQENIAAIKRRIKEVSDKKTELLGAIAMKQKEFDTNLSQRPELEEGDTLQSLAEKTTELESSAKTFQEKISDIAAALKHDQEVRDSLAEDIKHVDELRNEYLRWVPLRELLGDATGSSFKRYAHIHLLRHLIDNANIYMRRLAPRYSLSVMPRSFIIMVEDAYLGSERRSAATISGGESFLVSLALALALSRMGHGICADTLFIDEGFGSLSGEELDNAIATLRNLQARDGLHVGIISHVEALRESIPVKILVEPDPSRSASTITVTA